MEPEASATIEAVLAAEGLTLRTGRRVVAVSRLDGRHTVELDDGSAVEGEQLLVTLGRRANLRGTGLASVGLDETAHAVRCSPCSPSRCTPGCRSPPCTR